MTQVLVRLIRVLSFLAALSFLLWVVLVNYPFAYPDSVLRSTFFVVVVWGLIDLVSFCLFYIVTGEVNWRESIFVRAFSLLKNWGAKE